MRYIIHADTPQEVLQEIKDLLDAEIHKQEKRYKFARLKTHKAAIREAMYELGTFKLMLDETEIRPIQELKDIVKHAIERKE